MVARTAHLFTLFALSGLSHMMAGGQPRRETGKSLHFFLLQAAGIVAERMVG